MEDDAHLFFHCNLPRAVWFSSTPSLRIDNLPQESDGVQSILASFISNSMPDSLFTKIHITLWYIWKARNDNRFQRKTWTPVQVHHAVAALVAAADSSAPSQVDQGNMATQPQRSSAQRTNHPLADSGRSPPVPMHGSTGWRTGYPHTHHRGHRSSAARYGALYILALVYFIICLF